MVVRRVNMCYLVRETVELVLNEGSDREDFFMVLPTFELTGGNYFTLTASISDTFGNLP